MRYIVTFRRRIGKVQFHLRTTTGFAASNTCILKLISEQGKLDDKKLVKFTNTVVKFNTNDATAWSTEGLRSNKRKQKTGFNFGGGLSKIFELPKKVLKNLLNLPKKFLKDLFNLGDCSECSNLVCKVMNMCMMELFLVPMIIFGIIFCCCVICAVGGVVFLYFGGSKHIPSMVTGAMSVVGSSKNSYLKCGEHEGFMTDEIHLIEDETQCVSSKNHCIDIPAINVAE